MKLSRLGEFGLIKNLGRRLPDLSRQITKGMGDDTAVVRAGGKNLLITTDMLIEGIHFDLSFTTYYQLGFKFLAVNVSDILAMGGKPRYFVAGIGVPVGLRAEDIYELYRGLKKLAVKYGVAVVGGDTCTSEKGLVLSGTLLGETKRAVFRSGAAEGDRVYVTDSLGDSAMGLSLLRKRNKRIRSFPSGSGRLKLMKRHLMPEPAGVKNTSGINSMIDVSDGLLADLGHICDESGKGAIIYKERIPVSKELLSAAGGMGKDPYEYALRGGEDYVMLYTAPSKYRKHDHEIGEIVGKGRFIIDADGRKAPFRAEGYEHFRDSSQGSGIRGQRMMPD